MREVSCPALGLTRQEACFPENVWSRQAWLQPMHVLISSDLPSAAFTIKLGSARKGRAILIRSAEPDARMSSAVSGALILNGFKGRLGLVWKENGPQYIKVITS